MAEKKKKAASAASDSGSAPATLAADDSAAGEGDGNIQTGRLVERFRIAAHVILQIILVLVIFGQVNYLSFRRYDRLDLTLNRNYTLSDTSQNFLSHLDSDITIILASHESWDLYGDVRGLLSEYERIGGDRVKTEVLDLSRSRQRLADLRDEHQIDFTGNTIVILARDRKKVIGPEELAIRDRATNRIIEFRGEKVLTSALLEVTEQQQKKIYLVSGKRRSEELIVIARQFESLAATQNARVEFLSLEGAAEIPEDADALILAGLSEDLSEREADLVSDFWLGQEKKGGVLIMLDPSAETENLNTILREHGVRPENDRVLTVATIAGIPSSPSYDVPARMLIGSPVTRGFRGKITKLTGRTKSLTVDMNNDILKAQNIQPWPLMAALEAYWGETKYPAEEMVLSKRHDHHPAVTAASIEIGMVGDPNMRIRSSRLVVVSNPNLIDPTGNTSKLNADFAMAALNWTIDREELTGISPREPTRYVLSVSPTRFSLLQAFIVFIIPGSALLLGGFVWFTRRS